MIQRLFSIRELVAAAQVWSAVAVGVASWLDSPGQGVSDRRSWRGTHATGNPQVSGAGRRTDARQRRWVLPRGSLIEFESRIGLGDQAKAVDSNSI